MAPWLWFRILTVAFPIFMIAAALILFDIGARLTGSLALVVLIVWGIVAFRNRDYWLPRWRRPDSN
jgi:hypothetical protein